MDLLRVLKKTSWVISLILVSMDALAGYKLAVFYSSTLPANEREATLKQALPGENLIIFARSKDFYYLFQDGGTPPPLVIGPSEFETVRDDYEPVLQFTVAGKKDFTYALITTDDKFPASKIPTSTVGTIEQAERQKMKAFLKDKIGLNVNKINTVSKPEDLFPLLVFKAADVVVVSQDNYVKLKKIFTAETHEVKVDTQPILYPRVYKKKGEDQTELLNKIEHLNADVLKKLGFDGIERIQK